MSTTLLKLVLVGGVEPPMFGYQPSVMTVLTIPALEVQVGIEPTFIGLMKPLHYLICD